MILTPSLLDQLRQVVNQGNTAKAITLYPDGLTLGAALECACWWNDKAAIPAALGDWQATWLERYPILAEACTLIKGGGRGNSEVPPLSAPRLEVRRLASRADYLADEWDLFLDRFRRSLAQNGGFSPRASAAISKALDAMADNLIQHSGPDPETPARGLSAFHVEANQFSFTVADLGRGVLASLQENQNWATLRDSTSALRAVVSDHATRRPEKQYGEGFLQLFQWLADLNGILRFRSGDGLFRVVGLADSRQGTGAFTAPMSGFQVTVTCGRCGRPDEIPV